MKKILEEKIIEIKSKEKEYCENLKKDENIKPEIIDSLSTIEEFLYRKEFYKKDIIEGELINIFYYLNIYDTETFNENFKKVLERGKRELKDLEEITKELFYLINDVNELGLTCGYIRIIDICNMISKKFFSKNYENFLTESLK